MALGVGCGALYTAQQPRMPGDSVLVEVGWEVCNRVGGIYTVLRTKAAEMVSDWGDRYVLVGPLDPRSAQVEFEEAEAPEAIQARVDAMRAQGR